MIPSHQSLKRRLYFQNFAEQKLILPPISGKYFCFETFVNLIAKTLFSYQFLEIMFCFETFGNLIAKTLFCENSPPPVHHCFPPSAHPAEKEQKFFQKLIKILPVFKKSNFTFSPLSSWIESRQSAQEFPVPGFISSIRESVLNLRIP